MLAYLIVWEGTHRTLVYGLVALALWVAAWMTYLRNDIRNYINRRKPHRWGVDMQTKSVTAGPKPIQ